MPTETPTAEVEESDDDNELSTGAIVGIVVGAVVFLLIVIVIVAGVAKM